MRSLIIVGICLLMFGCVPQTELPGSPTTAPGEKYIADENQTCDAFALMIGRYPAAKPAYMAWQANLAAAETLTGQAFINGEVAAYKALGPYVAADAAAHPDSNMLYEAWGDQLVQAQKYLGLTPTSATQP